MSSAAEMQMEEPENFDDTVQFQDTDSDDELFVDAVESYGQTDVEVSPFSSPRLSASNTRRKRDRKPESGLKLTFTPPSLHRENVFVAAPPTRRGAFSLSSTHTPESQTSILIGLYGEFPEIVADSLKDMGMPAQAPYLAIEHVEQSPVVEDDLSPKPVIEGTLAMPAEEKAHKVSPFVEAPLVRRQPTLVLTPAEEQDKMGKGDVLDVDESRFLRTGSWHEDLGVESMAKAQGAETPE